MDHDFIEFSYCFTARLSQLLGNSCLLKATLERALRSHLSLAEIGPPAHLPLLGKPASAKLPLLFVYEPNEQLLRYIHHVLASCFELQLFTKPSSLIEALDHDQGPDLIMLAWSSMDSSLEVLQQVICKNRRHPILLLSASSNSEEIACAVRLGASGVIQKPFHDGDLKVALGIHLHPKSAVGNNGELTKQTRLSEGYTFVRSSQKMRKIEEQAALIAQSEIPVLLLGESGTGKEVLARYLHSMSARSNEMFLRLNCAAMPVDLLESELFGYEKGAFTGATQTKPGKFELCNGGTIFLDEIGEMPAILQAKLLHVLQDGTYLRLGGRLPQRSDVRVIAATNIDITAAVAQKTFREDLYYRLNGFTIDLPPLRERKDEIAMFARYFMDNGSRKYSRSPLPLSPNLLTSLERYHWPGNLRELENVINRYLITADTTLILEELLPRLDLLAAKESAEPDLGHKARMRRLKGNAESIAIVKMLEETKWNRKEAAKRLQVSYRTLLYKIRQYELARN
jgi:two-component system response regulator AtoC